MNDTGDYPLSRVLEEHEKRLQVRPDDRIACRRCPNADWIIEQVADTFGEDAAGRAWCAALGRFMWPGFSVTACDARQRAIRAERDDVARVGLP